MLARSKWLAAAAALCIALTAHGAQKPAQAFKKHQATGIVVSLSDTSLTIARGRGEKKTNWLFTRTERTRWQGIIKRGAKVVVYYHEEKGKRIADRIKVTEPAPPAGSTTKPPGKAKS